MPVDLDNSSTVSGDARSVSSTGNQNHKPPKKKRNLPGMPDPGAEVIALSPKTLMATNRFVCEICKKGFQRDQNLQLHRRGHNLPWKLRQRSSKEVRKKVYVCPVSGCVHHDPSRALGDLTGIKKHFCRKHGEKKYKCDKCSKKYAVQSDWKAHSKICGTKEYRCDCGTLFSRKDSFITHRAFCDVLAEETANNHTHTNQLCPQTSVVLEPDLKSPASAAPLTPPPTSNEPAKISSPSVLPVESSSESPENNPLEVIMDEEPPRTIGFNVSDDHSRTPRTTASPSLYASSTPPSTSLFAPSSSMEPISLCLSTNPSLFGRPTMAQDPPPHFLTPLSLPPPQPAMSATALLQKAAQMGSTGSGGSLLRGLGLVSSASSSSMELSSHDLGLGLLPCSSSGGSGGGSGGLKELMLGNSCVFGPKQTTLDFLGLGRAVGNGSSNPVGGLSALLTSIGGGGGMNVFGTAGEFSGKDIGRRSS
ncbi:PREDICTED: protein indeterminate-domain 1-like [Brassica oleracea var. oleracea]|uniref:C2H2-type domain-containing protein n=1 Tax=Brassica oleracea var. oleracea TaxID=109376 RepID=A0A0D3AYU5_BRAOL|nr:PREDICTED: protein indeterminate-domain 1-like [Brassica oleracea var. oleracea]